MNAAIRHELISDTQSLLERSQRPVHIREIQSHLASRGLDTAKRPDLLPLLYSDEARVLFEPDLEPSTGTPNGYWILRETIGAKPAARVGMSDRQRATRVANGVVCPSCGEALSSWVSKPSGPLSPGTRWAACDRGCSGDVDGAGAPSCPHFGCRRSMRLAEATPEGITGSAWRCVYDGHFELNGTVKT